MAALVIQVVCAIVNLFIKVSTHMAAIGGVGGALMAFAASWGSIPCGGCVWCFCSPGW